MATDLSQSLDLIIYWYKNYILLISTADRIDLILYYLFSTADRFTYDIGSKINDMSLAPGRSAIVYRFNRGFFVLLLVNCRIKSTGTLAYPNASFGPALELSRSPRPRVLRQQLQKKIFFSFVVKQKELSILLEFHITNQKFRNSWRLILSTICNWHWALKKIHHFLKILFWVIWRGEKGTGVCQPLSKPRWKDKWG